VSRDRVARRSRAFYRFAERCSTSVRCE
jgi:hypothetical protein